MHSLFLRNVLILLGILIVAMGAWQAVSFFSPLGDSGEVGVEDEDIPPPDEEEELGAHGTLSGTVDIGPICPVEQEGVPCPVPPEVYTSRSLVVYRIDGDEVARTAFSPEGTFAVLLAPGSYIVDLVRQGIDSASGLPARISITENATTTLSISIDTGIR